MSCFVVLYCIVLCHVMLMHCVVSYSVMFRVRVCAVSAFRWTHVVGSFLDTKGLSEVHEDHCQTSWRTSRLRSENDGSL